MSAFLLVRLDQTEKRQSDRQIEEETAFKENSGETNRWTSVQSKTLNLLLHGFINTAECLGEVEQAQRTKKQKKKKTERKRQKEKRFFSLDDLCYQ